ncbi:MAG: RNA methyltransferase [Chitinophagaceae bacterium]|nr:RNA methyltransferase [Chitinophagaceae bacterium]
MTPERLSRIQAVLQFRQGNLAVVMENVQDPHNIAAVMRTCDAVGIQDIYVLNTKIPRHKKFGAKSSSSAQKWLSIHQYDSLPECVASLKEKYDKLYCTHLNADAIPLHDMDFTQSMALVFGNEHEGVSEEMRACCDGNFIIPQLGMIQSLNISVACAITIYEAFRQKKNAGHYDKGFTYPNMESLQKEWLSPDKNK